MENVVTMILGLVVHLLTSDPYAYRFMHISLLGGGGGDGTVDIAIMTALLRQHHS